MFARVLAVSRCHGPKARAAASIAWRVSARPGSELRQSLPLLRGYRLWSSRSLISASSFRRCKRPHGKVSGPLRSSRRRQANRSLRSPYSSPLNRTRRPNALADSGNFFILPVEHVHRPIFCTTVRESLRSLIRQTSVGGVVAPYAIACGVEGNPGCVPFGSRQNRGARSGQILLRKIWRRGELNPRPRSLATRRLHAYPVPLVSPDSAQSGQDAPPASPIVWPVRYGPKRISQPTV